MMFGLADKALAIAGGAGCLILSAALAFTVVSKNAEIRTLDKSINDPVTGYAAKLKKAEGDYQGCLRNRITLEDAANQQSRAVADARAEGQARLTGLTGQLTTARTAAATAQRRADAILAARPTEDACASAEALILESLP